MANPNQPYSNPASKKDFSFSGDAQGNEFLGPLTSYRARRGYAPSSDFLKNPGAALARLRGGGVIILPTDTLYGLAARIKDEIALKRLFRMKGRSLESQVPVLIENPQTTVGQLVTHVPEVAQKLMDRFWPGPLTLVLPAKPGLPRMITGHTQAIGLRQSAHPVVRRLIQELGEPITGTSANLSGSPAPFHLEQISPLLLENVDYTIDDGHLPGRKGSTVLDFTGKEIKILRQGDLQLERIREIISL